MFLLNNVVHLHDRMQLPAALAHDQIRQQFILLRHSLNIWIFTEIRHLLDTGEELPPMCVADRVALAKRHFQLSLDLKGPVTGVYEMRRHFSCYFKGLRDFKETRIRLVTSKDVEEIFGLLDYIAVRWGADAPEVEGAYGL